MSVQELGIGGGAALLAVVIAIAWFRLAQRRRFAKEATAVISAATKKLAPIRADVDRRNGLFDGDASLAEKRLPMPADVYPAPAVRRPSVPRRSKRRRRRWR